MNVDNAPANFCNSQNFEEVVTLAGEGWNTEISYS